MGTDAGRVRALQRRARDAHQASVGVRARTQFLDAAECGKVRRMVPALLEGATRTGLSRDVAEAPSDSLNKTRWKRAPTAQMAK